MEQEAARSSADPFGEELPSWWQRLRGQDRATPKRVDRWVGGVAGLLIWAVSLHSPFAFLIVPAAALLPSWVLERHYRARRRREQERILRPAQD
jgi:Flp pilus assembly protein TadB